MRRRRFCQVEAKRLCSFHMRTALYVLLALAAVPATAGQAVWKWVDEKGVTHFSDQPVPGATKMELNSAPASSTPAPTYTPPPSTSTRPIGPAYSRFVIESPQQDEAIINTGGKVTVRIASTPAIAQDHVVYLYMDGALVQDFPSGAMSHEFSDVPRGSHTLKAEVVTRQGATVAQTPPVTFHVRQQSIANPPVGPNLRNPPRRPTSGNKMSTTQPSYSALNGAPPRIDPNTNMPVNAQRPAGGPKN